MKRVRATVHNREDRRYNSGITGAAADITAHREPNVFLANIHAAGNDFTRRDQHCRRAEAALNAVMGSKGLFELFDQRVVAESFHGANICAFARNRERYTGTRDLLVDQKGAGAADPVFAAQMDTGTAIGR